MPMKNPAHPGALVKDNIDELGLSVAEAAAGLGVTRQQLYKVINGDSAVTPEMALRLEKAFGGSADAWLRMQSNFDLAQVRARQGSIAVKRLEPKVA
jgi:addiction module HigA family antidote